MDENVSVEYIDISRELNRLVRDDYEAMGRLRQ